MGRYSEDPAWADVEPIPLNEGGPHPLAAIAYSEAYKEAMAYLRAVMAKNEHSQRALDLTEDIVASNPAHYTVWYVNGVSSALPALHALPTLPIADAAD